MVNNFVSFQFKLSTDGVHTVTHSSWADRVDLSFKTTSTIVYCGIKVIDEWSRGDEKAISDN